MRDRNVYTGLPLSTTDLKSRIELKVLLKLPSGRLQRPFLSERFEVYKKMSQNVVIRRPVDTYNECPLEVQEGQCSFLIPSGRKFQLAEGCQVMYEGSPIDPSELDIGTRAAIKISNSVVSQCEICFLKRKPTLLQLYSETVFVFSRQKFSTMILPQILPTDAATQPSINLLQSKFAMIRKVAGEGKHAFLTAVGLAYLEHLVLPSVSFTELEGLYALVDAAGEGSLRDYLNTLWEAKQKGSGSEALSGYCNSEGFGKALVKTLVALLVHFAKNNPEEEHAGMCIALAGSVDEFSTKLEFDNELEQQLMMLVSFVLPIKLKIYSVGEQGPVSTFDCDQSKPELVCVNLLSKTNTFCVLYTTVQCRAQEFKPDPNGFATNSITKIEHKSLYYKPKQRVEIKTTTAMEEHQNRMSEVQVHLNLHESVQKLISSIFIALDSKTVDYPFFSDELISKTYESKVTYRKQLSALRNALPDPDWMAKVSHLEMCTSFASGSMMKQCKKCDKHPGVIFIPACKDYVCDLCMREYLNDMMTKHNRILEPNGDAMQALICPIISCPSPATLPTTLLQSYLGPQYDYYIEQAERVTLSKKCVKCAVVHEQRFFYLVNSCGCKVCAYCLIELVGANQGQCLCGMYIPQNIINDASYVSIICQACGQEKSLLRDFTPVKCETHIICIKCLESAMNGTDRRCPVDYRPFAEYEIAQAKPYFRRSCQLYCGRSFETSEGIVPLFCRCVYCWDCGKYASKYSHEYTNCFLCATPFPPEVLAKIAEYRKIEQFMVTIKVDLIQVTKCSVCMEPIGKFQKFVLQSCAHDFHLKCLKDYASNYVGTDFRAAIKCPQANCKEIDPNVLEHDLMTPKEYSKYCDRLTRIALNIVQCPKCKFEFEYEKNPQVEVEAVRCHNCNYAFCSECKQEFTANHDQRLCRHNSILQIIAGMTAVSTEPVAQCPGCQTPYQKDDHCDHVKCLKPGCVDWCFKCSCLRAPTLEHHNAWHRPSCPNRSPMPQVDDEPVRPNCPECKRLGRRCDPPKDLKVPCRFDLDEY